MDYLKEVEGKSIHDHFNKKTGISATCKRVPGPVIVGAGPSGLATAACLKDKGVPSLILERANCIASLWKIKTYDRLRLHLPKQFCQLPLMPFPENYPTYPNKEQFLAYLDAYTNHFALEPIFNQTVVNAEYDPRSRFWRVKSQGLKQEETEYLCQWLIVATGENAEEVVPCIEGMDTFGGKIVHSSSYRSGEIFHEKNVLVVGCGNSGMEVSLDLCNYNARPSLVVRDAVAGTHFASRDDGEINFWIVHVLAQVVPRASGGSNFTPNVLVTAGDTAQFGLRRPKLGPIELKNLTGKTPVLDIGTLAKIKYGNIKVRPGIKRLTKDAVEFVDGRVENFDAIILATGFKSNVPTWLKVTDMFSEKDGLPRKSFPTEWKGAHGLYAAGFTKRGLLGASIDARKIAEDIELHCKAEGRNFMASSCAPIPQSRLIKGIGKMFPPNSS